MREYRFNLFGVGGVLILGRRGPRLKAIVDAVEIRTPDDSALARVRAADPASDDDLVTRRHLQASTTPKLPLPATGERLIASHGTAGEIRESPVTVDSAGNMNVPGNLTVQGDSVILNTEVIEVEDQNIVLAKNATTDAMANGGGITLKGTLDKIFVWLQARAAWFSSENIDLAAGKELRVDGTEYLAAHSTTNLPEGTNLYFTDQRARDANNDHRADGDIHISAAERTAWNDKANQASFNAHIEDIEAHFAPSEKAAWSGTLDTLAAKDLDLQAQIDALGGGGAATLEEALYGVAAVNEYATLHEQFATIATFVAENNLAANPFRGVNPHNNLDNRAGLLAAGTPTVTVGASGFYDLLPVSNGKILIAVRNGNTTAGIKLYEYIIAKDVIVDTGVSYAGAGDTDSYGISLCNLSNGVVLLAFRSSSTTYVVAQYNPALRSKVLWYSGGVPIEAIELYVGGATSCSLEPLPDGMAMLAFRDTATAVRVYKIDPNHTTDDAIFPVGGPLTIVGTAIDTIFSAVTTCRTADGRVLIMVAESASSYSLTLYDHVAHSLTPMGTMPVTATGWACMQLMRNGKVFIAAKSNASMYSRWLVQPSDGTIGTPATWASSSVGGLDCGLLPDGDIALFYRGTNVIQAEIFDGETGASENYSASLVLTGASHMRCAEMPNGAVLLFARASTTVYNAYLFDGTFGTPNRYKFPLELLLAGLV